MKIRNSFVIVAPVLLALSVFNLPLSTARAQGTAFAYQGQLQNNGSPAHGTFNFQFSLFTSSTNGTAVAGPVTNNAVLVTNGLFAVSIDFGSTVWNGATNFLEIAVETNKASSFTALAPRQQILPVPYAIFAEGANAAGLIGTVPVAQLPTFIVTNSQGTLTVSNLEVNGTVGLPSASVIIYSGTNTLFIADSNSDFFAGPGSGNLTCAGLGSFGNAASGVDALANIAGVVYNTANGYQALFSDTEGEDNTANGALALYYDTNGTANTASGFQALYNDTSGSYNTANGYQALVTGWTNSYNTANGALALSANWGGSGNTASGAYALESDTTGSSNTADGYLALSSDNFGSANTAVGVSALYASLSGSSNTAVGVSAMSGNTVGYNNTAVGNNALLSSSSGWDNTAVGVDALEYAGTFPQGNTAVGFQALQNTMGGGNTANGYETLQNNGSGGENTADGGDALRFNTGGSENTALGFSALNENVSGSGNTALGWLALTALGITTGVGGTSNIAVGVESGSAFIGNESRNIDIGNYGVVGESGIIRIGTAGQQTATYLVGNVYTPSGSVQSSSDRNAKEDFAAVNPQQVLAKVATLPVTEWNYKSDKGVEHIGPMAQDFHAAFGLNGGDDKHISVVDEGGVALAAIQGLNQRLEDDAKAKDQEIAGLKQENDLLTKQLNELTSAVKALEDRNQAPK
ncbi:MAG TPA: tail fiber domain-containing protein [Verrucomicrobiae bacterium]|nr:tail fiber domain-containing protein [Verrucomicrobiae bacterium]